MALRSNWVCHCGLGQLLRLAEDPIIGAYFHLDLLCLYWHYCLTMDMGASKEAKTNLFASWGLIVCVLGCCGRGRCPLHERLDCTHHKHAAPLSEPIKAHRYDLISRATKLYIIQSSYFVVT